MAKVNPIYHICCVNRDSLVRSTVNIQDTHNLCKVGSIEILTVVNPWDNLEILSENKQTIIIDRYSS